MSALLKPLFVGLVKWEVQVEQLYNNCVCWCSCLCISKLAVCQDFLSHFSVSDSQTVLTFSKWHRLSISLARTPKEWSVRPVRLAPFPFVWITQSWSISPHLFKYDSICLDWFFNPGARTRVLNSGRDFGNCQPSILNSPTPEGKICRCVLVVGLRLN